MKQRESWLFWEGPNNSRTRSAAEKRTRVGSDMCWPRLLRATLNPEPQTLPPLQPASGDALIINVRTGCCGALRVGGSGLESTGFWVAE